MGPAPCRLRPCQPSGRRPHHHAPAIVVYSLRDARGAAAATAAAALDLPVSLRVPADIAAGLGADVIGSLFASLRAEFPQARVIAAVDCADAPGLALALLRRGIDRVRVEGPDEMRRRLADIAAQSGAALNDEAGVTSEALDLLTVDDPQAACEAWLKAFKNGAAKPNCQ